MAEERGQSKSRGETFARRYRPHQQRPPVISLSARHPVEEECGAADTLFSFNQNTSENILLLLLLFSYLKCLNSNLTP